MGVRGGRRGREPALSLGATPPPDDTLAVYLCCGDGTCNDCSSADLLAVGSKPAGDARWGHSDLSGSVSEWTFDWYDSEWYDNVLSSGSNVCRLSRSNSGDFRVSRGGSFFWAAKYLRAANRQFNYPDENSRYDGLRCARTP